MIAEEQQRDRQHPADRAISDHQPVDIEDQQIGQEGLIDDRPEAAGDRERIRRPVLPLI